MKYIKVPYSRLRGKTYGGDLTPEEAESISGFYADTVGDGASEAYGGTFQELYKAYKNGEDPLENASNVSSGAINNPEKMLNIHNAIVVIANKYGYASPDESELTGTFSSDIFQKISVPNSYFIATPDYGEHVLIITDKDSNAIYLGLPVDNDWEYSVSADKNGNILIPKEAYDEDLEVF